MDRAKQYIATLVSATLLPAFFGITAAHAQANGSTNDIPGALPGVHLVSPVAAGQWTMPAGDYANTRLVRWTRSTRGMYRISISWQPCRPAFPTDTKASRWW